METVTLEDLRKGVGEYLGLASMPKGNTTAYDKSIKAGLDYCWRYATWRFAIKRGVALDAVTVNDVTTFYMPADFDILGWRDLGTPETDVLDGSGVYLKYDDGLSKFIVNGGSAEMRVAYQVKPPAINTVVYFPSLDPLFLAAGIMQKFKDNPNSTQAQQQWDILHTKLDQLSGQAYMNTPKHTPRNRYEKYNTFVGDKR